MLDGGRVKNVSPQKGNMLKKIAYLFGFVLLVIGVLGFIPAFSPGGNLLGYFHVNVAHNVVHLVTGLLAIGAAYNCCVTWTPKLFFQVFGVVYLLVALLGFWHGADPVLGFIANNTADSVLHLVIAVISLYLGFLYKE